MVLTDFTGQAFSWDFGNNNQQNGKFWATATEEGAEAGFQKGSQESSTRLTMLENPVPLEHRLPPSKVNDSSTGASGLA